MSTQTTEDMRKLQREVAKWAERTFPGQTVESKIKHMLREVEELLKKPRDKSEMADVFLLLLHVAHLGDTDAAALVAAGFAKLEINKMREWGEPDADGIREHVREATHAVGAKGEA